MDNANLSRRERQIMDALFADGEASVNQIRRQLPDPPSPMAVRTFLKILSDSGHVRRRKQGREFIYRPTRARSRAGQSALRDVIERFFDGSVDKALGAHLSDRRANVDAEELDRLAEMIERARRSGE